MRAIRVTNKKFPSGVNLRSIRNDPFQGRGYFKNRTNNICEFNHSGAKNQSFSWVILPGITEEAPGD
jgi:hypothetical protein